MMLGELKSSLNNLNDNDIRIIKKDLVYVMDLPADLASEKLLSSHEYFGQYGSVKKIIINKWKSPLKTQNYTYLYSAYVTFSKKEEAALTILALDGSNFRDKTLKISYGMTKYCNSYLRGQKCLNQECLF